MIDPLTLSSTIIDSGDDQGSPVNRVSHLLSEIGDGIAMVEAFSHCMLFATDDGLVAFDTSNEQGGQRVVEAVRRWRADRFHTVIYTHGHIDHVGGAGAFAADAAIRGTGPITFVAHENVPRRFERYEATDGYNHVINERQFGEVRFFGYELAGKSSFLPRATPRPDVTYRDTLALSIGGLALELRHGKGETDDHTWTWIPEHKAICAGDFFIWNFPNAGNPQKVQRYPAEWAAVLRTMAAQGAELFLPAHGLPIAGSARIQRVLVEVAEALEHVVRETIAMMNEGARLDDIVHRVKLDPGILARPYLRPLYDEPEFVVRNVYRQYGGWYDGNPAHLKPAPEGQLATELAGLAGGALKLAERAAELTASDLRLACHLVELAALAAPEDPRVHAIRAEVYGKRRNQELSLMARGIFGSAANDSAQRTQR